MLQVLPKGFINSLQGIKGFDYESFIDAHEHPVQVTSIRLNPLKPSTAIEDFFTEEIVPWCNEGRYLSERPSFTLDPAFHGGAYYVQEASSMFLDHVIKEIYKDQPPPARVLDLCAAPGGKSTLLAAALPGSFIVSNEVIKTRVSVLAENISKWGYDNVIVTNNDPKDFKRLPGFFDLMVVDAPCSGSGLFRKDANATREWSEANVEMCSWRQQRILADSLDALKDDGYLMYSTCSYSRQEDEDICDWMVEEFGLEAIKILVDDDWEIVETISEKYSVPGHRFYPNKVKGEGFFICCFKKVTATEEYDKFETKPAEASKQVKAIAEPFFKNADEFIFSDQKEIVIAFSRKWEKEPATTIKKLNVKKSGVAIGTVKGKDFIPHHELALSHLLSPNIAAMEFKKEEALKYLKRQDLTINSENKGWIVCIYKGIKIGWIKVLPNRVNNYYPTHWRILKN